MMSTLPQAQLYSLETQNSWISSTCQSVPSEIHCQSVFYCISLPLSSLVRGPQQTRGASTPGPALISREKELQIVLLEVFVRAAVHYIRVLLRTASKSEFLSSVRHFALKPYRQ